APHITRQRLLIEGFFSLDVDRETIKKYLFDVAKYLNLRTYGEPTIYSPEGMGKGENQGYDAFIPLIDSGISLYVWTNEKFMSVVFYTCKNFSEEQALIFTKKFFDMSNEMESKLF
ncbi:MAG TPA: S-adenosylmethionine decarboxylase, partial [Gammaproteobacteria bacterium]|nr:S-adenosylmethionine decarboxylase [Gammaproteobacteria bacterium]